MANPFEGNSFETRKSRRPRRRDRGCLKTGSANGSIQDSSQIPMEELTYLNQEQIYFQDSQSKKTFVCQLCSDTFPTLSSAMHHARQSSHLENMQAYRIRMLLLHLPPITTAHRAVLNRTLESAVFGVLADPVEVARRQAFATRLMSALSQRIPNLQIIGSGSTWNGLAMPDSDVNIDVCRKDPDLELARKFGVTPGKTLQTIATDSEVARSPSLGYLLSDIFGALRPSACDSSPETAATPRSVATGLDKDRGKDMPNIYRVVHTDSEPFCVSFADAEDVNYQIATGTPYGADTAALIRTYLSLDQRALNLAILFRKLSKLGHLDMPLLGTFPPTVLPILVIFYLQHRYPTSLLPNLHRLYLDHKDELSEDRVHSAHWGGHDLSFVKDVEWIKTHWTPLSVHRPADGEEQQPQTAEDVEKVNLADLWLGLLRFYLFDFQKRRCIVNIMESEPVQKSYGHGTEYLVVVDPFEQGKDLCRSVSSSGFNYIYSQMKAAYGYFGVPRLVSGRHLFTNVRTLGGDRTNEEEIDQSGHIINKQQHGAHLPRPTPGDRNNGTDKVHLSPVLDDSNGFGSNLIKVRSLLSEKFKAELSAQSSVGENQSRENGSSADDATESIRSDETRSSSSEKPPAMIQVDRMIPHIFSVVLDELIDSEEVPFVVQDCLEMQRKRVSRYIPTGTQISMAKLSELTTFFARAFWSEACSTFVNRGAYTIPWGKFVKRTVFAFDTLCKFIDWTSDANSLSSDQDAPTKSKDAHPDILEHTGQKEEELAVSACTSEDDKDLDIVDKPDPIELVADENDAMERDVDSETEHNCLVEDSIAFIYHPDMSLEPGDSGDVHIREDEDENLECIEQTLDLGEDTDHQEHDMDTSVEGYDHVNEFNLNTPVDELGLDGTALHTSSPVKQIKNQIPAGECEKSVEPSTTDTGSVASPHAPSKADQEGAKPLDANASDSINDEQSARKRRKGKRRTAVATATAQEDSTTGKTQAPDPKKKKSKEARVVTWEEVILSPGARGKIFDDDRPEFYNSSVVESVTEDDLSFPFAARGRIPQGKFSMQASVLGLAASNEPSTLLAHFGFPEPQCKACGKMGHRMNTCGSTADQSVSFSAWRKLRSSVSVHGSHLAPDAQIAALSECLIKLAGFHDCSDQTANRKGIVDMLQRVFARQYPNVSLQLFGSCANGFELPSSDMDLCVFFPEDTAQWRELRDTHGKSSMIRRFKNQLYSKKNPLGIVHIRPILHAKVPILKVRFSTGCEVDISFSNYLALINTKMLKMYTRIDPRLRILGVALKIVVKLCELGNASMGGVSSYAFIIMLIHYLQQKNQLPVLQEMYDGPKKPTRLVGGWNAWYQDNMEIVNRLWKRPEEKTLLGDLWLGFFHYYLFEFDRDVNVITIRQKEPLPRFVKMWSSLLAVEDPFNLDHNLTGALSRDILLCILDVFQAVLKHHTTFVPRDIPLNQWQYSLFSPTFLNENRHRPPPSRAKCNNCNKCGHRAADCPLKDRPIGWQNEPVSADSIESLIGPFLTGKRRPDHILPTPRYMALDQSPQQQFRPPTGTEADFFRVDAYPTPIIRPDLVIVPCIPQACPARNFPPYPHQPCRQYRNHPRQPHLQNFIGPQGRMYNSASVQNPNLVQKPFPSNSGFNHTNPNRSDGAALHSKNFPPPSRHPLGSPTSGKTRPNPQPYHTGPQRTTKVPSSASQSSGNATTLISARVSGAVRSAINPGSGGPLPAQKNSSSPRSNPPTPRKPSARTPKSQAPQLGNAHPPVLDNCAFKGPRHRFTRSSVKYSPADGELVNRMQQMSTANNVTIP